jgi:hypothetical protein
MQKETLQKNIKNSAGFFNNWQQHISHGIGKSLACCSFFWKSSSSLVVIIRLV